MYFFILKDNFFSDVESEMDIEGADDNDDDDEAYISITAL